MKLSAPEVTLRAKMEGVEEVSAGFQRIGGAAGNMGTKIATSSQQASVNFKSLASNVTSITTNMLQLGDIAERVSTGQMDLGRGAVMLGLNLLQLAGQVWSTVLALKSMAIAQAIAHALSGPVGWAILAAAVAAAVTGLALAATIPSKQLGGKVEETGPYILHRGEYVSRIGEWTPFHPGASIFIIDIHDNQIAKETMPHLTDEIQQTIRNLRSQGVI